MLDVFISEDGYLNIVLEYVKDGTLFSLINTGDANSEAVVRLVYHCCCYDSSSSASKCRWQQFVIYVCRETAKLIRRGVRSLVGVGKPWRMASPSINPVTGCLASQDPVCNPSLCNP
jgi:hypothetical protein